ncbi:MAG: hypothetical protein PVI96_16775, partial [Desulfobacterales bacterium]
HETVAERTALVKILIPFNYLWQRPSEVNIKRRLPRFQFRRWRFRCSAGRIQVSVFQKTEVR